LHKYFGTASEQAAEVSSLSDLWSSNFMSSEPVQPATPTPQTPSTTAAILSFLIPGLGQIYQGRYGKGLLFMVCLLGMFFLGQAMGQWQNVYLPREDGARQLSLPGSVMQRWHFMGQFWIGVSSFPALWQYWRTPAQLPPGENPPFWDNYQKAPDEAKLNEFLVSSDKSPDLGWVYTVIAGMLNILVIYDAYAGPLIVPGTQRPTGNAPLRQQSESRKEGAA